MAWKPFLRTILRQLIDDDVPTYTYTDERLDQLLISAAVLVMNEVDFTTSYTIDVTAMSISPDPITQNDDGFKVLVPLKAAWLVAFKEAKAAAGYSFSIKDGPSTVDGRGVGERTKAFAESLKSEYNKARMSYKLGRGMRGEAIVTPYAGGFVSGESNR